MARAREHATRTHNGPRFAGGWICSTRQRVESTCERSRTEQHAAAQRNGSCARGGVGENEPVEGQNGMRTDRVCLVEVLFPVVCRMCCALCCLVLAVLVHLASGETSTRSCAGD